MNVKHFAVLIAVLVMIAVIEKIREQKMTFKYSLSWLTFSGLVVVFAFNDHLLYKLAGFFGFQLTSNFIFFLMLIFFVFLSLFLTIYINEQNSRAETLAQSIALLEYQINELKSGREKKKSD